MQQTTYQDFILWPEISADGTTLAIRAHSPAGEAKETIPIPAKLPGWWGSGAMPGSRCVELDEEPPKPERLDEIGARIFATFFPGSIRGLFERSCAAHVSGGHGLRLKICFGAGEQGCGPLHEIPWELLFYRETKDFLARSRRTPVSRFLEVQRPRPLAPLRPPLRVLMVSGFQDPERPLDLEHERLVVEDACRKQGQEVSIVPLARATRASLDEQLRGGSFQALHYMGHGEFAETRGEGGIDLETPLGMPDHVTGEELADLLKEGELSLVVLNACDTGRASANPARDLFAGVATAIVQAGVPAVVAMRRPISDGAAISFSKALYHHLAAGEPVDVAVAEGRRAILHQEPGTKEWALPMVLMRIADGRLFDAGEGGINGPGTPPLPAREAGPSTEKASLRVESLEADALDMGNRTGPLEGVSRELAIDAGSIKVSGTARIFNVEETRQRRS